MTANPQRGNASSSFTLGKRTAVGGMAEVYLAVQRGFGGFEKLVVVKRMLPHLLEDGNFVQMFLDEARLAARLRHPNIVSIIEVRRDEDVFTVAMEYLRGEDLRHLIREQRDGAIRIPLPITLHIMGRLADALHFAHMAKDERGRPLGLVHRDVAPSNVIVTYDGQVKLIDFGVAKASAHATYTTPGTIKGKFPYSSPEQICGKSLDARSDIFSFGILMHELLTGRRLFKGDSPVTTLRSVLSDPIPRPRDLNPDVPREVEDIVMGALKRDVDARTKSARVLRQQVGEVLTNLRAKVTTKDLARWMTDTFPEDLRRRMTLEREATAAARERANGGAGDPSDSQVAPSGVSGLRPASDPGSSARSRSTLRSPSEPRSSSAHLQRLGIVPTRSPWLFPLVTLGIVLVLVALVSVAFIAGRALSKPAGSEAMEETHR